jgi:hypothetical protein
MCLVVAVACWIAFIFWVIFSISSNFSFVSVSAVFLSFNLLPLTYLVFFMTHGGTSDCEEGEMQNDSVMPAASFMMMREGGVVCVGVWEAARDAEKHRRVSWDETHINPITGGLS